MIKRKESLGYRVCIALIYLSLTAILVASAAVFIHIVSVALSSKGPANANQVSIYPVGLTLDAVRQALDDKFLGITLLNSLKRLVIGVSLNMLLIILAAYPLSKSKKDFPAREVFSVFVVFTMLFNGGLVPNYLLVKDLGLMDTVWALVLPTALPVYLCVILMNFFRQLPKEIEEAAFIDGASHFRALMVIYLPLVLPALATVCMFSVINHWNAWFDGLIYTRKAQNYPYTSYLRYMIQRIDKVSSVEEMERMEITGQRPLKMAYVLVSVLPVFVLYPVLQKYVKSGLTVGSVKG